MSQEKVDRYKKEKMNRQKLMRREKWVRRLEYGGSALVLLALVCWFSFAVYKNAEANRPIETSSTEMDVTALQDYLYNLSSASAAEE